MTNKTVLVVDDDKDVLDALASMLDAFGYRAITDSGISVAKKLEVIRPDVILLDIMLSGLDGRDICKLLKNTQDTKDIPVILISANADAATSISSCGADDFLAKPF